MEGRTFMRIGLIVLCVATTGLGYRNSNGDNSDAIVSATKAACSGADDCSASLEQQSRGSFGHEYSFKTERGAKKTPQRVIVACEREYVFLGDWRCGQKTRPAP